MAILTNIVDKNQQELLLDKILADTSLIQATLYYRFYLNQAIHQVAPDKYLDALSPWHTMIADGLTTFAESDKRAVQRSDCHAWSASPNYDFLATVCGIRPASFGFKNIEIKPALGKLKQITATMPHPQGTITLFLERKGAKGLVGKVSIPTTTKGYFIWSGKKIELKGGEQTIALP